MLARLGGYDLMALFGALYQDESGGHTRDGRIGIATSLARVDHWLRFAEVWQPILRAADRETTFHAVNADAVQTKLNLRLASLMKRFGVFTTCITLRQEDFAAATESTDRSRYGGPFGFARYLSLFVMGQHLRTADQGEAAYLVEAGGKGYTWFIRILAGVYASDDLRREYRMASFGPSDRRKHLPAHAPDLVSHEVITARHTSEPLRILGGHVEIIDVSKDLMTEAMASFRRMRRVLMQHRDAARRARKKR